MSASGPKAGDVVGRIRHRLLLNWWVDPDEVGRYLPPGVRPRVGSEGTIVGCCLIAIDDLRPWPLPVGAGREIRAAAHRIAVEAGPQENPVPAVYVPSRHTDSRLARAAGGRLFPGVHKPAAVRVGTDGKRIGWEVAGRPNTGFAVSGSAHVESRARQSPEIADTVIGTTLGISPSRGHAGLEGVEMIPEDRAHRVVGADFEAEFISTMSSARSTDTLLMTDMEVVWRRSRIRGTRPQSRTTSTGDGEAPHAPSRANHGHGRSHHSRGGRRRRMWRR